MSLKPREILVVDLAGTLLSSDILFDSFWSAFGRDPRNPFLCVAALTGDRASLKRYLATASAVVALKMLSLTTTSRLVPVALPATVIDEFRNVLPEMFKPRTLSAKTPSTWELEPMHRKST